MKWRAFWSGGPEPDWKIPSKTKTWSLHLKGVPMSNWNSGHAHEGGGGGGGRGRIAVLNAGHHSG